MDTIFRYRHSYCPLHTTPCNTYSLRHWSITTSRHILPILPVHLLCFPIVKRTLNPWGLLVALAGYITIQRRKLKKVSPSGSMLVSIPTLPTSHHITSHHITSHHLTSHRIKLHFPLLASHLISTYSGLSYDTQLPSSALHRLHCWYRSYDVKIAVLTCFSCKCLKVF